MSRNGKYYAKKLKKDHSQTTLVGFFRNSSNVESNSESDQPCTSPQSFVTDNVESNVVESRPTSCNSRSDQCNYSTPSFVPDNIESSSELDQCTSTPSLVSGNNTPLVPDNNTPSLVPDNNNCPSSPTQSSPMHDLESQELMTPSPRSSDSASVQVVPDPIIDTYDGRKQ